MEVTPLAAEIQLPTGWHQPRVRDIAARRANATVGGPFGSDLVAKDYVDSGVPVIRGQNMGQHHVAGEFAFVSPAKAKALQANLTRPSDLVFTQRGTLGQVALVPTGPYEEYVISQSQMKLTLDIGVAAPGYVYQYFASALGQKQILDSAIQTGVPHTNLGILRNYAVPMPRQLDEQRAISAALTDTDALIDSLEQLLTKKRQIKQGTMQELLTGERRLPGFCGAWDEAYLGALLHSHPDYGINAPAVRSALSLPTYLRITDIDDEGRFRAANPVSVDHPDSEEYYLRLGDVVFARTGASVGKSYLYRQSDGPLVFAGFLIRVQPDAAKLVPEYLFYFAKTRQYWNWVTLMSMRSGQPGINSRELASMPVLLPRGDEQRAIASVLSDMDAEINAIESRITKARTLKQAIAQALLTGRIRLVEPTA